MLNRGKIKINSKAKTKTMNDHFYLFSVLKYF